MGNSESSKFKSCEPNENFVIINDTKAPLGELLRQTPDKFTEDDYEEVFGLVSLYPSPDDFIVRHFFCRGLLSVTAIIFIPTNKAGVGSSFRDVGLRLFSDNGAPSHFSLLPSYLDFVNGLVYSHKPLPVEKAARLRFYKTLRKVLTNECLSLFEELSREHCETWASLWDNFGWYIKKGVCVDFGNRGRLKELLRFQTSAGSWTSLQEYKERMHTGQHQIFFASGESPSKISMNASVSRVRAMSMEVLLMPDPIDELVVSHLKSYDNIQLQNVTAFDPCLYSKQDHVLADNCQELICFMKEILKDQLQEIIVSRAISSFPSSLTIKDFNKARISRCRDVVKSRANSELVLRQAVKPVLEINPENPIIRKLSKCVKEKKTQDLDFAARAVEMLFFTAHLASGVAFTGETLSNYQRKVIAFATMSID